MLEKSLADIPKGWVRVDFDPANIMRSTMAWYRELGLPLIPVWGTKDGICLCKDGADCESAGKHPITSLVRSGVKNASLEAKDHRHWLKRHPDMNIATALPGFTVIDCDSREAFLVIRKKFDLPPTFTIRTGRGFQLVFRGETRSRTGIALKVDIKSGANAYVVGAASLHRNGRRYAVWDDKLIADLPPEVEAWIMDDEPPRSPSSGAGGALFVTEGGRNDYLNKELFRLRAQGYGKEQLHEIAATLNQTRLDPPLTDKEVRTIVRSALKGEVRSGKVGRKGSQFSDSEVPELLSFDRVKTERIEWLWYPYIARGTLGLLDGFPGEGKSQFLCWLAATISKGRTLPGGVILPPMNTFLLNLEDLPGAVIKKRLEANGADLTKIFIQSKRFRLDDDMTTWLDEKMEEHSPALLIVDPIQSFITDDVDTNNNISVRHFMERLADLAERNGCAVICVRHFGKTKHGKAMLNGIGSTDFVGISRNQLGLAARDDDELGFYVFHMKTNFQRGKSMLFSMSEADGRKGERPRIRFVEFSDITADEYLSDEKDRPGPDQDAREDARAFLQNYLAEEPKKAAECKAQGQARGLSHSTLSRAKEDLKIVSYRNGTVWFWKLPDA